MEHSKAKAFLETLNMRFIVISWLVIMILFSMSLPSYAQNNRSHITTHALRQTPNIIVILTDDMGFSDISAYGGPYPTPNIDRLASQGIQFTHYFSPAPICSPSRVGLLTGMEPDDWNIYSFEGTRKVSAAINQANFLDPVAPTIARTLKKVGYETAHFGKWHMGGGRDVYDAPKFARYGFDEHASTYESPEPDPLITATDWIWSPQDSVKRWERTGYFVDKTLDFLKRHKGTPSFVNLWPDDMHTPWVPGKAEQNRKPRRFESEQNFEAVLKEYDRQIGRLLDGLKELGIADNTIVIFTSDNGPYPTFDGKRTDYRRGSKFSLYQGGTRLPFIVRWPGHTPAGKVDSTSVISGLDIYPTLASIVGVPMPSRFNFDGEPRKGPFLGSPSQRSKPLYWEYGSHGDKSVYIFPAKAKGYHTGDNFEKSRDYSPNLAIRQGKWKLLINYDGSNMELYNMETDQKESNNVAELHPEIANKLKEELIRWRNNVPKLRNYR